MTSRHRLSRHTFPRPHEGARASTAHFSISYGRSSALGGAAVIVSKKVARRSVDRHLLKRRVLDIIAPWASGDRFLVVYARSGSTALTFPVLKAEIAELLMKTNLPVAQ